MSKYRKIIQLFLYVLITTNVFSQVNLIPNYSFEEMINPVDTIWLQGIDRFSNYWFTPNKFMQQNSIYYGKMGEADLFSTFFHNSQFGVPFNNCGYQNSFLDSCYAGIILKSPNLLSANNWKDGRDYIEVKLKQELQTNREYCIEFYYSIAETSTYAFFQYKSAPLEILFSDTLVYFNDTDIYFPNYLYGKIHAKPQISQMTPAVIDLENWIKYEDKYIAKGGENYIVIGNFDTAFYNNTYTNYVYIDAVKIWYCGPDTTPAPQDLFIPNVFTPNGDGVNDFFEIGNTDDWQVQLQIFNRWGLLVFESETNQKWDGTYQGQRVSEGVYFYVIHANSRRSPVYRDYKGSITVMYD